MLIPLVFKPGKNKNKDMYYFIATIFFYVFPLVLLLQYKPIFGTKKGWLRIMIVLQLSMIVHALFFARQLIGLYQFAKTMGLKSSSYMPPMLELLQMGILILWPFLLLNKKLSTINWIGIPVWLVLLSLPRFVSFETVPLQLFVNCLFCFSLFTGIFGLVWLLKRFSDQSNY